MTNSSVNQTVTDVNSEGQAVKVVQVATNAEQIAAAGIGLVTAGPLGAVAAWGALKAFAGKWTPWGLTGIVAAPVLGVVQLAVLGTVFTGSDSFKEGLRDGSASSSVESIAPSTPSSSTTLASNSPSFGIINFDKIENGMTLPEVEAIIGKGKKGTTLNSSFGKSVTYSWGNIFGLYGNVTFRDGRVTTSYIMDNR